MTDRHRPNYFEDYRKTVIQEAINRYGGRCTCQHCVADKHLKIILKKRVGQGQYGAALFLKRNKYKKGLAKILCRDCTPVCNHAYPIGGKN